jgi:hypothetical protein
MLSRKEFDERVRQVVAYYSAGVNDGSFEHAMDDLTVKCSDAQWHAVQLYLEQVDEWLAETDKATLRQKENAAAKREHRKSRYPGALSLGTLEADVAIAHLRRLYGLE